DNGHPGYCRGAPTRSRGPPWPRPRAPRSSGGRAPPGSTRARRSASSYHLHHAGLAARDQLAAILPHHRHPAEAEVQAAVGGRNGGLPHPHVALLHRHVAEVLRADIAGGEQGTVVAVATPVHEDGRLHAVLRPETIGVI